MQAFLVILVFAIVVAGTLVLCSVHCDRSARTAARRRVGKRRATPYSTWKSENLSINAVHGGIDVGWIIINEIGTEMNVGPTQIRRNDRIDELLPSSWLTMEAVWPLVADDIRRALHAHFPNVSFETDSCVGATTVEELVEAVVEVLRAECPQNE